MTGMPKVVILGGGIAGMSAAHELIERGFAVDIYEALGVPGGKARSIPVAGSGTGGRVDLPGEHGFRFFPHFYQHLIDTMQRIPYRHGRTVADNLVPTSQMLLARRQPPNLTFPSRLPRSRAEREMAFRSLAALLYGAPERSLAAHELQFFGERLWQILTTCRARRLEEYDSIGWWEFIEAEEHSEVYRELFGDLSRTLVAAQPQRMSTKTAGDILLQLLLDLAVPWSSTDRVLNGPTSETWLYPWLTYLLERGVRYYIHAPVQALHCDQQRLCGATIGHSAGRTARVLACTPQGISRVEALSYTDTTFHVHGDYYLAALPLERMQALVTQAMLKIDPTLEVLRTLQTYLSSMNGVLFYLKQDLPVVYGHINHSHSQWALTSISQQQFWPEVDLQGYGDGTVKGILSVIISDWQTPGLGGKAARDCSSLVEIKEEVWRQLQESLNHHGQEVLQDAMLHSAWIAEDIVVRQPLPGMAAPSDHAALLPLTSNEPLLVNHIHTWHVRPEAFTRIANLFLASDYVRTHTDLATMEAANEAARRAVNCIIDVVNGQRPWLHRLRSCRIWSLHEPWIFWPWRAYDWWRNWQGLPWDGQRGLLSQLFLKTLRFLWNVFFSRQLQQFAKEASAMSKPVPAAPLPSLPPVSRLYQPPPVVYRRSHLLSLLVRSTPDITRSLVPAPLQPNPEHFLLLNVNLLDSEQFGAYNEVVLAVPSLHVQGTTPTVGQFCAVLYVDNDAAIAAGREIWGFPKKYGTITVDVTASEYTIAVERAGVCLLQITVDTAEPLTLPQFLQHPYASWFNLGTWFNLKHLPAVNAAAPPVVHQLTQTTMVNLELHTILHSTAQVIFTRTEDDPLPLVGAVEPVASLVFHATGILPHGEVLHDYLQVRS